MDLGDLKHDKVIQEKLQAFDKTISKIDTILEIAFSDNVTKDLSIKDKLNYDLFIAYTLNTLYYLYLRSNGIDANSTDVKKELNRVKDYMLKAKSAIERHTHRQKVNQPAAERFIKHGLGLSSRDQPETDGDIEDNQATNSSNEGPATKKRKIA